MYFFSTQSALLEIQKLKNNTYLIGDKTFDYIPDNFLKTAFLGANWNRALKYQVNEDLKDTNSPLGYILVKFDLYLDFKKHKTIAICKDIFLQKIINQKRFRGVFIDNVFKHKNKHKIVGTNKKLTYDFVYKNNLQITEKVMRLVDKDHFLVSSHIDLQRSKFKDIFVVSNENKITITDRNQRIYYVDFSDHLGFKKHLEIIDYLDIDDKTFYLTTHLNKFDHDIIGEFKYTNQIITDKIKVAILQSLDYIADDTKLMHLFNITQDYQHLIKFIDLMFEKNDFDNAIKAMQAHFEELRLNYFVYIFKVDSLTKQILNKAKTKDQKNILLKLQQRYN